MSTGLLGPNPVNIGGFSSIRRGFGPSTKASASYSSNRNFSVSIGQICGKHGHETSLCRHHFNNNYQNTKNPPTLTNDSVNALVAMKITAEELTQWHIDFSATDRIVTNPDIHVHSMPRTGKSDIMVGNGNSITIMHEGPSIIPNSFGQFYLNGFLVTPSMIANLILSVSKLTFQIPCYSDYLMDIFYIRHLYPHQIPAKGVSKWYVSSSTTPLYFTTTTACFLRHQFYYNY